MVGKKKKVLYILMRNDLHSGVRCGQNQVRNDYGECYFSCQKGGK